MSCTAQHDVSDVLFKPLLNFALGLSEVKYIQLIKLVPQKMKIAYLVNITKDAILNLLARDSLGTS